jgi:glycosidase
VPGELDSVFYFSQHFQVFHDVFEMAHDPTQQAGTSKIAALWAQREMNYSATPQEGGIGIAPKNALVNFLDNHDVARFLFDAQGDVPALRNALTLLFAEQGIPNLYYGTEQEFSGGNDPSNREVLWNTNFATNGDTFRHIAKLARIRQQYLAIRRGDTKVVFSTPHVAAENDAGMFAFERTGGDAGDAYALVVLNTNGAKASSAMFMTSKPSLSLTDVLDPQRAMVTVDPNGNLSVDVPQQSAMILVPSDQVAP